MRNETVLVKDVPQKWYKKTPSLGDSPPPFGLLELCRYRRAQLASTKETELQRLFSTFPGGGPGFGLLLLRAAIGLTAAIQGAAYIADRRGPTFEMWVVGLAMAASGMLLVMGFLTPVASAVVALGTIGIALLWFPEPTPNLFNTPLPAILVVTIAAAIVFLGAGNISVDRRLFGRREIIIPHTRRPPGV